MAAQGGASGRNALDRRIATLGVRFRRRFGMRPLFRSDLRDLRRFIEIAERQREQAVESARSADDKRLKRIDRRLKRWRRVEARVGAYPIERHGPDSVDTAARQVALCVYEVELRLRRAAPATRDPHRRDDLAERLEAIGARLASMEVGHRDRLGEYVESLLREVRATECVPVARVRSVAVARLGAALREARGWMATRPTVALSPARLRRLAQRLDELDEAGGPDTENFLTMRQMARGRAAQLRALADRVETRTRGEFTFWDTVDAIDRAREQLELETRRRYGPGRRLRDDTFPEERPAQLAIALDRVVELERRLFSLAHHVDVPEAAPLLRRLHGLGARVITWLNRELVVVDDRERAKANDGDASADPS